VQELATPLEILITSLVHLQEIPTPLDVIIPSLVFV
jgi:hypothetical protein